MSRSLSNTSSEKEQLSPREREILDLILNEKTSQEIAKILGISPRTVDTYRRSIYLKTGTSSLVGLVKFSLGSKSIGS